MDFVPDTDNQETQEWLDSLSSVIDAEGTERAHFLIEMMIDQADDQAQTYPIMLPLLM